MYEEGYRDISCYASIFTAMYYAQESHRPRLCNSSSKIDMSMRMFRSDLEKCIDTTEEALLGTPYFSNRPGERHNQSRAGRALLGSIAVQTR